MIYNIRVPVIDVRVENSIYILSTISESRLLMLEWKIALASIYVLSTISESRLLMLEWKIASIYYLQYPSPGYVRVENNPAL